MPNQHDREFTPPATDLLISRRLFVSTSTAALTALPLVAPHASAEHNHMPKTPYDRDKCHRYRNAALRGLEFLVEQMAANGGYSTESDLAAYYKSLWLLHLAGRNDLAYRRLDHIKASFMLPNGDFRTAPDLKSANGVLTQYYPYMNGWLAMGSHRLGRFDLAQPAYRFLSRFSNAQDGGFFLQEPTTTPRAEQCDVFITSHLGLAALYAGDVGRASQAGQYIQNHLQKQPDLESGLYLRTESTGALVTEYPDEAAPLHFVSRTAPWQLYFFVGYPSAFMAKLYEATGDRVHLQTAQAYLTFAQSCDDSLYEFYFSHKVAWASSIVARLTGDQSAFDTSTRIADYLLSIQDRTGGWLLDQPPIEHLDQSAEIAIWLLELSAELDIA